MKEFWIPALPVIVVIIAWPVTSLIRRAFSRRPRVRTSAMQRLIALNPTLNVAGVHWNVAARRIRIGWVTKFAIAVAFVVAIGRPIAVRG